MSVMWGRLCRLIRKKTSLLSQETRASLSEEVVERWRMGWWEAARRKKVNGLVGKEKEKKKVLLASKTPWRFNNACIHDERTTIIAHFFDYFFVFTCISTKYVLVLTPCSLLPNYIFLPLPQPHACLYLCIHATIHSGNSNFGGTRILYTSPTLQFNEWRLVAVS